MKSLSKQEPELATGWTLSRVEDCLCREDKGALVKFIAQCYENRFLNPIKILRVAPSQARGYGFAIMALCSLLIESLQSYRYGLPTKNKAEFKRLAFFNSPTQYEVPENQRKSGGEVFWDFFSYPPHRTLFPGVDGKIFYTAIRNGLLHQAQTKDGWRIRTGQSMLWNAKDRILDRNKFADGLASAFKNYTQELSRANGRICCGRGQEGSFGGS